jgi:hypothetical protein
MSENNPNRATAHRIAEQVKCLFPFKSDEFENLLFTELQIAQKRGEILTCLSCNTKLEKENNTKDKEIAELKTQLNNALAHIRGLESEARG